MAKKFEIRSEEENGELLMSPGFQSNVDAWFRQYPYHGEVRRFEAEGMTVIMVSDARDTKANAIASADTACQAAGIPTYSQLVANARLSAFAPELAALVTLFGDAVADVFEQLVKGNWIDGHGHRVEMNQAMINMQVPMVKAIALRDQLAIAEASL